MFEIDFSERCVVDRSNGDRLVVTDFHRMSTFKIMAVLSAAGIKTFEFTIKTSNLDDPDTWPKDRITRLILLHARTFEPDGRSNPIHDMHPEIERLIDWERRNAMSKTGFVAFKFIDERATRKNPVG